MTIKKMTILMLLAISLCACNNNPEANLDNQTNNILVNEPSDYELKIKKLNALTDNFKGFSISAFKAYQEYISSFGSDADHYKSKEVSDFLEVNPNNVRKL